jgi:hypothetical protein
VNSQLVIRCALVLALLVAPFGGASSSQATSPNNCTIQIGPGIAPPANPPKGISGFHATWYGQSGYMTLCPGDSATAVVAYYNSGSLGWTLGRMGEVAYLGTWGPHPGQDRASVLGGDGSNGSPNTNWPRFNRIAVQPAPYVGPGQVAWFQFSVRAPSVPGTYKLYLRPLIEGAQWMEDFGVFWLVTVASPMASAPTPTPTIAGLATPFATQSVMPTTSASMSPTATPTGTGTPTATTSPTQLATSTPNPTTSPMQTPLPTSTSAATPSPTPTAPSYTPTPTSAPTPTPTSTPEPRVTVSPSSATTCVTQPVDILASGAIPGTLFYVTGIGTVHPYSPFYATADSNGQYRLRYSGSTVVQTVTFSFNAPQRAPASAVIYVVDCTPAPTAAPTPTPTPTTTFTLSPTSLTTCVRQPTNIRGSGVVPGTVVEFTGVGTVQSYSPSSVAADANGDFLMQYPGSHVAQTVTFTFSPPQRAPASTVITAIDC